MRRQCLRSREASHSNLVAYSASSPIDAGRTRSSSTPSSRGLMASGDDDDDNGTHVILPCFHHVPKLGLVFPSHFTTLQAFPVRSFPWKNETVRQQCPLLRAQDTSHLASQYTVETVILRNTRLQLETQSHSPCIAHHSKGAFLHRSFAHNSLVKLERWS